jgi:hypothetical protein
MRKCLNNVIESAFYTCNKSKGVDGKLLHSYFKLVNPENARIFYELEVCVVTPGSITASNRLSWPYGLTQNLSKLSKILNTPIYSQTSYVFNYTINTFCKVCLRRMIKLHNREDVRNNLDFHCLKCLFIKLSTVSLSKIYLSLPSWVACARREGYYSTPVMVKSEFTTREGKINKPITVEKLRGLAVSCTPMGCSIKFISKFISKTIRVYFPALVCVYLLSSSVLYVLDNCPSVNRGFFKFCMATYRYKVEINGQILKTLISSKSTNVVYTTSIYASLCFLFHVCNDENDENDEKETLSDK